MPLLNTFLDLLALSLAAIHFGVPSTYYWYLRKRWLPKPWGMRWDPSYKPKISIIVPTYNEAELIEKKLDNIYEQDYLRERLEVIVVDSVSTDGTLELVRRWAGRRPDLRLVLVEEPVRRGKGYALNVALSRASGEVVVVTDADSLWPSRSTLSEAVKWLSDPAVGAVSCVKQPAAPGFARAWIASQAYLVVAAVKNLWTKEIAWEKQSKTEQVQPHTRNVANPS